MKTAGLAIVLAVLGLLPLSAAARAGEVSLVLRPVGDGLALDCLFQYAHWITAESGTIEAGTERVFAVNVAPGDGTISMANTAGIAMALERIVCSTVGKQPASQYSLPLQAIRDAEGSLVLVCRDDDGLSCEPTGM